MSDDEVAAPTGGMGEVDMDSNYPLDDLSNYDPQEVGSERDVSPDKDGGVTKKLLVRGEGFKMPEKGDEVTVHYVGTLLDGTEFDSSRGRDQPFVFTLGTGSVIKGWDVGVATMNKGEKCLLTCKPAYAYGAAGSPPKIPADATLQFEVELLSWKSVKDLTGDECIIKTVTSEGTGWETAKDIDGAVVSYALRAAGAAADAPPLVAAERVEISRCADAPCPGLTRVLVSMKAGESARVNIKNAPHGGPAYLAGLAPAGVTEGVLDVTLHTIQKVERVSGTDDEVLKKILAAGTGYERPNEGASVTVKFSGALADGGAVFAPESERTFLTDDEAVPEGLDRALLTMHKGETALVTVPPKWGYGAAGDAAAGVPGGATLQYTVTMLDFVKDKESWDLKDGAEKLAYAEAKKGEGNALFAAGKAARALRRYSKALKMIEYDTSFPEESKKASKALKVTLHSNTAQCKLKAADWRGAEVAATKALDLDSSAAKARFRRAQALMGMGEHFDAERDLKKLLDDDPNHKEATRELVRCKKAQREQNQKDAAMFSKMWRPKPTAPPATPAAAADAEPAPMPVDEVAAA